MANETDYSPRKYTGNGSTREYSFDWKIFDTEEITVIKEKISTGERQTLTEGTDYRVSFGDVGGYITMTSAPTNEYSIIITRNVSAYQSKRYSTSTGFQGSEIENSFDKVSCNLQEAEYELRRAIKVPIGSQNLDLTLPAPSAHKLVKWNQAEDALENSTVNADELESIAQRLHASIDNIDTVAGSISSVNTVADDLTNIDTVAGNIADVISVAGIKDDITAVKNNASDISAVADDLTNIDTVAGSISSVNTVADDLTNIDTVAGNITDVNSVATAIDDIIVVSNSINNINSVAEITSDITAVKNNASDISAVADDLTNIDLVAGDLTNIDNASNYASLAEDWANKMTGSVDGSEFSAKYYAQQAAQSQVQSNWSESDTTSKSYIQNKPTKLSDFTDDLGTNPTHSHSQYLTAHQDISGKENTTNKVLSLSSLSTDTEYPSAKCVYDALQSAGSAIPISYEV